MSLPELQLIPASAGSGKTFRLKEALKQWVVEDASGISAETILAVTFTEAAAAELRQRIRGALLQAGRLDDAARLEEAYVSTIHSFGLRVLRESAFDLGAALSPRLLTDDEQQQLMRRALGRSTITDGVTRDLTRFGYSYDFHNKKSPEDVFRGQLLKLIAILRSTGDARDIEALSNETQAWMAERYGKLHEQSAEELAKMLRRRVDALLAAFPEPLTQSHGTSGASKTDFARDFDALRNAQRGDALIYDWKLWKTLGELRVSKRGCPVPEDYEALAEAVIEVASMLSRHPGPLATAQEHIDIMLRSARDANERFTEFKKESGLLDYTDMVAGAYAALCEPEIANQLRARIDCLVIDEFQDTNPIQFGLLWQLIRMGPPTMIVGDTKQSIMGFQGADPRLFEALINNFQDAATPLESNWRSQPELLTVINAISATLFPDYKSLAPQAQPSKLAPLHVLVMKGETGTKSHSWRGARIAEAIQAKLADPKYLITDRHTKIERRLRGGDCAVLCPTHSMLSSYAQALRDQGIPVRLKQEGWLASNEIQIALQALALVHDPEDKHARLYLAVTALGAHTLEQALRKLVKRETVEDPAFANLLELSELAAAMCINHLVPEVLRVLGIHDAVALWPEARQARANLLRLEGLAQEFVDAQPESLVAAGIHGHGLPQFLSWLHQKAEQDDTMPAASVIDEHAVELVTWHAAKGREWPLVAVCGMAHKVDPKLPNMRLGYPDFSDLDNLIQSAGLEFSPSFDSKDTNTRLTDQLTAEYQEGILREIYVAITRPRDQLLLEWPLDALDGKSPTRGSLLQDRAQIELQKDAITVAGGDAIAAIVETAEPTETGVIKEAVISLPTFGRRALHPETYKGLLTPDSRAPSRIEHEAVDTSPAPDFREIRYAEPLVLPPGPDALSIGDFVHRVFEVGADSERSIEYHRVCARDLWPDHAESVCDQVIAAKQQFEQMLYNEFEVNELQTEVPVIGLDGNGSVINGLIDLIASTPSGLVIIDHKTDRLTSMDKLLARHAPQLADYAELLGAKAKSSVAINAVMAGCLLLQTMQPIAGQS